MIQIPPLPKTSYSIWDFKDGQINLKDDSAYTKAQMNARYEEGFKAGQFEALANTDEGPEFTFEDPDLANLLNLAADITNGNCTIDIAHLWLEALEVIENRLKKTCGNS